MGSVNSLTAWRIEKAQIALNSAKKNLAIDEYGICLNRCYYAVFYAMRAANSLYQFDSKKHSGVIASFHKDYVKTGVFAVELGKNLQSAFNLRSQSDYRDFYIVSKEKVSVQVSNAETFVETVKRHLLSLIASAENSDG